MKRFRGGIVFEAHRLVYHSTLGLRVIKKKREDPTADLSLQGLLSEVQGSAGLATCLCAERHGLLQQVVAPLLWGWGFRVYGLGS